MDLLTTELTVFVLILKLLRNGKKAKSRPEMGDLEVGFRCSVARVQLFIFDCLYNAFAYNAPYREPARKAGRLSITKNARDDCDAHTVASSVDDVVFQQLVQVEFADLLVVHRRQRPPCLIRALRRSLQPREFKLR